MLIGTGPTTDVSIPPHQRCSFCHSKSLLIQTSTADFLKNIFNYSPQCLLPDTLLPLVLAKLAVHRTGSSEVVPEEMSLSSARLLIVHEVVSGATGMSLSSDRLLLLPPPPLPVM